MKHLTSYKIFEADKLKYDADWKRADSPIRKELQYDIDDILLELSDDDSSYKRNSSTGGWIIDGGGHPYIWISRGGRAIDMEYVSIVVERLQRYLQMKGYETKVVPRGTSQIYIYFDETLN